MSSIFTIQQKFHHQLVRREARQHMKIVLFPTLMMKIMSSTLSSQEFHQVKLHLLIVHHNSECEATNGFNKKINLFYLNSK